MATLSSPPSPLPASFDKRSIRGSTQSSPLKPDVEYENKLANSQPATAATDSADQESEIEISMPRTPKPQKSSQKKRAAPRPNAKAKPTAPPDPPERPSHSRRASRNVKSYEESETDDDESEGAQGRETSSEIDVDAPLPKAARRVAPTLVQGALPPPSSQESSTTTDKAGAVPGRKRQPLRGNWSVSHLLQSETSKLKDCDLEALLCHPRAWSSLTPEQQHEICAMLPATASPIIDANTNSTTDPTDQLPNLPQQLLKSNSTFRSHIRLFQEELAAGRFHPTWLADARRAMDKRANGDFDAWKETEREKFWGQKQKVAWTAIAGDSAQWNLTDMARGGCFLPGDMWVVSRGVRRDKGASLMVQKEATLLAIAEDWSLTFSYPPLQHKLSAVANGENKTVEGVENPNALAKAIVAEDGRIPTSHRAGNAWREVRCFRRNQDMGSLWDVRETFHVKQGLKS